MHPIAQLGTQLGVLVRGSVGGFGPMALVVCFDACDLQSETTLSTPWLAAIRTLPID